MGHRHGARLILASFDGDLYSPNGNVDYFYSNQAPVATLRAVTGKATALFGTRYCAPNQKTSTEVQDAESLFLIYSTHPSTAAALRL
jgi:hypothetical protein